jgi:aminoglycoside phosphotransferase family enzyme/predicted kinase
MLGRGPVAGEVLRMARPDLVEQLLRPESYPHACETIRLVETHISWVFLTGDYAYKVKKPVLFNFVDFSSARLRKHYCEEELRCNRAFSPELYLDVVEIVRDVEGEIRVGGTGEVVEHAVKMRQFPEDNALDRLLIEGVLEPAELSRFGAELATLHAALPRLQASAGELERRILGPVLDNFATLKATVAGREHMDRLEALESASRDAFYDQRPTFSRRLSDGYIRECHGDLHLRNLVMIDGRVRAFDCLEFNPDLRWIDIASDAAFLIMDCSVRDRADLAYAFQDGYLTGSGDYVGATLSPFYQTYRSVVRAKVAALEIEGSPNDGRLESARQRLDRQLSWAWERIHRPRGRIVLMCGLSGSGKSYVAERLVPRLPAVRIRSDVLRRTTAGLDPGERSGSAVDAGLYTRSRRQSVYAEMQAIALALAAAGEIVIVDATFLERSARAAFRNGAAAAGVSCLVLHCRASEPTLRSRVETRERQGKDVSEAGVAVLEAQLKRFEPPGADEETVMIDTEAGVTIEAVAGAIRTAFA